MNFEQSLQKIKQIKRSKFKEKYKNKITAFSRKRKLSFEDCLMILLNKKARNMQTEIDEYFEQKGEESVSRQGFAKARENINPQAILALNKSIIDDFEVQNTDKKLYKNHRIFSIDGSYISLPNTKQAIKEYGFSTNQNGIKRAKGLAMTIYDSLNELTIHAELFKRNDSEKKLVFEFIDYLKKQNYKDIIIVLDRGYPSFQLMDYIEQIGYKYVIRVQSNFSKITTNAIAVDSQVTASYHKTPVNFRVLNIPLSSGTIEKIVTNLDEKFDVNDIEYIYKNRWEIEKSFDVLKNKVCLESFSGGTKNAILQDFYAAILIQNISAFAYREQAKIIKSHAKVQPNMTHTVGVIKRHLIKIFLTDCNVKRLFHMFFVKKYILKYAVYSPPNRYFNRSFEHRSKSRKFAKKLPF